MWAVLDGHVILPWIKFRLPDGVPYSVNDALLCRAMSKMVLATDTGILCPKIAPIHIS